MKLEVKKFGQYSLHITFPKKACKDLNVGDIVEVLIDGKTTASVPQFDPSKLEKRMSELEEICLELKDLTKPLAEEKAKIAKAKHDREMVEHNKFADDGNQPAPGFQTANQIRR